MRDLHLDVGFDLARVVEVITADSQIDIQLAAIFSAIFDLAKRAVDPDGMCLGDFVADVVGGNGLGFQHRLGVWISAFMASRTGEEGCLARHW